MANILYGVNGEGSGHSTRAKEVILHLQEQGHRVHVVSSNQLIAQYMQVRKVKGARA